MTRLPPVPLSHRPTFPPAIEILQQISDALEAVHAAGIIHRDLKPSNILLTGGGTVKVVDFGVAGLFENAQMHRLSRLTMTGTALGTAGYAAPEQVNGRDADARADIYALGVIAYELLTGTLPQGVFEPPSVKAGVDAAFDAVVLTAMQSDPAKRFQSAADFRTALQRAADVRVQAETHERELRTKLLRRTRLVGVFAALALIVAGLAGFALWQQREAELQRQEADKLVNFLVTDLRTTLQEVHRLDQLETLMKRVEKYYASSAAPSDDQFLVNRAKFHQLRAEVRQRQNRRRAAVDEFRAAVAVFTQAVTRSPANIGLRRELGYAHQITAAAEMYLPEAEREVAFASYRASLKITGDLLRRSPDNPEFRESHGVATLQFARSLHGVQRVDEARTNALEGAALLLPLVTGPAPALAHFQQIAAAESLLGLLDSEATDLTNALVHYQRAAGFARRALVTNRWDDGPRAYVAECEASVGHVLNELGRPHEALAVLREAVPVLERASQLNPGHTYYPTLLLAAYPQLQFALGATGHTD